MRPFPPIEKVFVGNNYSELEAIKQHFMEETGADGDTPGFSKAMERLYLAVMYFKADEKKTKASGIIYALENICKSGRDEQRMATLFKQPVALQALKNIGMDLTGLYPTKESAMRVREYAPTAVNYLKCKWDKDKNQPGSKKKEFVKALIDAWLLVGRQAPKAPYWTDHEGDPEDLDARGSYVEKAFSKLVEKCLSELNSSIHQNTLAKTIRDYSK